MRQARRLQPNARCVGPPLSLLVWWAEWRRAWGVQGFRFIGAVTPPPPHQQAHGALAAGAVGCWHMGCPGVQAYRCCCSTTTTPAGAWRQAQWAAGTWGVQGSRDIVSVSGPPDEPVTRTLYFRTDVIAVHKRIQPWSRYARWTGVSFADLAALYQATAGAAGLVHVVAGPLLDPSCAAASGPAAHSSQPQG